MNNIDLSNIAYTRKNLIGLLGILEKDENIFTHVEFANWCGGYRSEWRRADTYIILLMNKRLML